MTQEALNPTIPAKNSFDTVALLIKEMSEQIKTKGFSPKVATVIFAEDQANGSVGMVTSHLADPPPGMSHSPEHALDASMQLIHALSAGLVGEAGANDVVGFLRVCMSQIAQQQQQQIALHAMHAQNSGRAN